MASNQRFNKQIKKLIHLDKWTSVRHCNVMNVWPETVTSARQRMELLSASYGEKAAAQSWPARVLEADEIIQELKLTKDDVLRYIPKQKYGSSYTYRAMPKPPKQDNKQVHVGNGGSNKNKIRYPKKARSRATWKRFYELFPHVAIKDNWDGKTSDRMK